MTASLSVIIPTLNRVKHLTACLASIEAQKVLPDELILVDQSDGDDTRLLFENAHLSSIKKVYVHQKTKSLILARNNGIDHVAPSNQFIGFLDDDLELKPDFFEKLLTRFDQDKSHSYAGGMGTFESFPYRRKILSQVFMLPHHGNGRFLPNGAPTFPHWKKDFTEVEFLSGGITVYRAEILKNYRYDERLIGYGHGDDVDVSYRISRKYKMFYEPQAKCVHDDESPGRDPGKKHRKFQIQNTYYLLEKNVGKNFKSLIAFWALVTGSIIDDLIHLRKGAFIGNFIAIKNIWLQNLDSVTGYREFKQTRGKLPRS